MNVEFGRYNEALANSREQALDKFIPIRKEDLLGALVKQGHFADTAECELFRRLARTLRTICHYEYSETLDRLRDDFREVRFYRRGRHFEKSDVTKWLGLHRRTIETEVFDDLVVVVAMKTQAEINSRRELRTLKRRKIVPGSVLLKYFHNIAVGDLYALFPNARVVMSNFDKAFLGVPAIAGGIPILLNLYATISVLIVVIGVYLGGSGSVADAEMKTALAALTGIVALGGFAMQQRLKYQRRSLKHHVELADNIYYRNVSNNAGVFDYLISTAEDQECKQALLAYHFIRKMDVSPTKAEIAARIEAWLAESFEVRLGFDIAAALKTLDHFGLVRYEAERLSVPPLEQAIAQFREVWNNFFNHQG